MKFGVQLRNIAFWSVDALKGGTVRRHVADIRSILENPGSADAQARRQDYLYRILEHAAATVPFYKPLSGIQDLEQFPVLNKLEIREAMEMLISKKFAKDQLIQVVTSGSTGTPFRVFQDQGKKHRNTADTLYFAQKAGFVPGQKLYYFKIWNQINRKKPWTAWMQNIEDVDVTNLSDVNIKALIAQLRKDISAKAFLGYASAYDALCSYMVRHQEPQVATNLKSVLAMSEGLSESTKKGMFDHFGCAALSRYSNVENGILGQQTQSQPDRFMLNHASYWIELLSMENNTPVPAGTPGRIVVTDFYNFGMPIIRYDTGDIGIWQQDKPKVILPYLTSVEGRRMDQVYDTRGSLVSSFTITNNMWKYPEVVQYQFIQKSKDSYLFKLNLPGMFSREKELIEEFKQYFGENATVEVEYVSEIPVLNSGKRKKVTNECSPETEA